LVSDAHAAYGYYPRHLNIGPADSPEGGCELVKWCQVSQQW